VHSASARQDRDATDRPNIVLIIGDDHGYTDFGFAGALIQTPNLDRLADEGTLFTRAYNTSSICSPSLGSLLTGLHPYQYRWRILQLYQAGVVRRRHYQTLDFKTLPRQLAKRGYVSFQGGKINEASYRVAGFSDGTQRPGDSTDWFGEGARFGRGPEGIGRVLDFIDRNQTRPFFIWYAPGLPHLPHDAPERFLDAYAGEELSPHARAYYANITRFDETVGELVGHIDARGLRVRTLIVYLADNGWDQAPDAVLSHIWVDGPRGKGTAHELGLRTPIIFNWSVGVPPGRTSDLLVSTVDLFPTLLDYGGAAQLPDRSGISLKPIVEGRAQSERSAIYGSVLAARRPDLPASSGARFARARRRSSSELPAGTTSGTARTTRRCTTFAPIPGSPWISPSTSPTSPPRCAPMWATGDDAWRRQSRSRRPTRYLDEITNRSLPSYAVACNCDVEPRMLTEIVRYAWS